MFIVAFFINIAYNLYYPLGHVFLSVHRHHPEQISWHKFGVGDMTIWKKWICFRIIDLQGAFRNIDIHFRTWVIKQKLVGKFTIGFPCMWLEYFPPGQLKCTFYHQFHSKFDKMSLDAFRACQELDFKVWDMC